MRSYLYNRTENCSIASIFTFPEAKKTSLTILQVLLSFAGFENTASLESLQTARLRFTGFILQLVNIAGKCAEGFIAVVKHASIAVSNLVKQSKKIFTAAVYNRVYAGRLVAITIFSKTYIKHSNVPAKYWHGDKRF